MSLSDTARDSPLVSDRFGGIAGGIEVAEKKRYPHDAPYRCCDSSAEAPGAAL
jgi:hypothetical protein